ncbi:uncharacterized protein PHACADRAFT_90318 [Phanerochaete carnosa HHB-10118-sp]|uniref:Peptidase S53 activation domain-containing protein n=1 Tax=Phanerochaete carnosa (strain HHB-10118-sp) TaxID=650164 RepID=K5WHB3_PHACS|nr:uncharacterized protein PHACADRAFT_90318 [Phanerochaete carnosa HHB-10118-sp]EKM58720.1 hypothetical protein PHACADRAFT_90318 [Phanerochaete carnosa HHB-10118-sp]
MVSKLPVFAALFSVTFAKPMARSMKLREAIPAVPDGYVNNGPAPADTQLNLRIALAQSDPDGLIDALYDVSTPTSSSYGQHLSKEETASAVNAWLTQAGVNAIPISPAADWLSISVPVSLANDLFDADFTLFNHSETGKRIVRTMQYSIPVDLEGHLDVLHPTVS